ncbi:MAG: radical SAM protein [Betaproteobacteria bacterium]
MTPLQMALPVPPPRNRPLYLATAEPVTFGAGFHDEEREGLDRYRWMAESGSLRFASAGEPRFMELWVLSEFQDLSQTLTCTSGGESVRLELVAGWAPLGLTIPAGADTVELRASKRFPDARHPGDARPLAVRLREPLLHRDPERHARIVGQHENWVRNVREMLDRRVSLDSTPVSLGIDLHGVCNVKPPCVYCEWDYSKDLEGPFVDAPFTPDTLREWGPFFEKSVNLVNCSIGEPFMMKEFDDLLDAFGDGGKVLEMTTNGQILTDRNIQKLLGRPIDLYISLDAGTPETYAKLRNDRFEAILRNLERLIAAKGGPGRYPHVHLVFMPMRINVHELERFVRICASLRVDRLVLRPLNDSPSVALDWERNGYRFEYQKELLPFDELVRVSGRAAELCRQHGVSLADQMDFGGAMGAQFDRLFEEGRQSVARPAAAPSELPETASAPATAPVMAPRSAAATETAAPGSSVEAPLPSLGGERKPACTEPWKSLYILRRGVFPCCYGGTPVAPMDQYREAWNGPLVQAIRAELSEGRFHDYCLRSPACPIVRKSVESRSLPVYQLARVRIRRWWAHVDHATGGAAGKVQRAVYWVAIRAFRAATDPAYVARHARRLIGRPEPPAP